MVARALRDLHALTGVAMVLLAGCASDLESIARASSVEPAALVRLSETFAVAAHRSASGVDVVAFRRDSDGNWAPQVIAGGAGGAITAHLITMGGQTGEEWNSFLYGTAPVTASRVTVAGLHAAGGRVNDGAWVLALRQRDAHPGVLSWSVTDADGVVIGSGTGVTP